MKQTVNSIESVTGNSLAQTAIFLASLNPMMFSFSANILNRFVYFRGLRCAVPDNLNSMLAIMGSSWGVKSGKTNYEDNSPEKKRTFLDKLLGIQHTDQNPPFKFKEMKFTDIYIKSALPIILINFTLYLVVLMIIMINKSLQESEVERLKKVALMKARDAAQNMETPKLKKTIMKTFQFAEMHFKWNAMIRTNLLIYQNFTLGLFLNIAKGYRQNDKALLKVSFVLSSLSVLVIYSNGYVLYYIVEKYYKSNKKLLQSLKEKKELMAQRMAEGSSKKKNKISENDTVDMDDSVMELKGRNSSKNKKNRRNKQIKIIKKSKKLTMNNAGKKTNKVVPQKSKGKSAKKNGKNKNAAEVKPIEKKKPKDPSNIYPTSLSIFNDLEPYHFYSRHYYTIRYILKPTIYSATITIFYTLPFITLFLMLSGFVIDFYLSMKNFIFKKKMNNKAIMFENGIFILVSLMWAIFVASKDAKSVHDNSLLGYIVMALLASAFITLVVFKIKGKKAL